MLVNVVAVDTVLDIEVAASAAVVEAVHFVEVVAMVVVVGPQEVVLSLIANVAADIKV